MKQFAHDNQHFANPESRSSGKLSFLRFLFRYPLFLLAFGPPIFRSIEGIDSTKGVIDFWAFFQTAWLGAITVRAIFRLSSSNELSIPKPVRSALRYVFLLGLLFLVSAVYSPSHLVSAAYALFYFSTMICVAEFIADANLNPPDWVQSLIHLRFVVFLLFIIVLCTIPLNFEMVMKLEPGAGIRLNGGSVAPVTVICPFLAVISAYTFLFSLESKARSIFFFMVGLAGTVIAQSRGCELGLLAALMLVVILWGGRGRRTSYLFLAFSCASVLLGSAGVAVVGGERIWSIFNRGQNMQGVTSASGRTDIWKFVVHYCAAHPWGMGYIAGFRVIFREYFTLGLQVDPTHIGNAHNAFMDVLADAGWLALAVYLFLLLKIFALGWRYARRRTIYSTASEERSRHALCCALAVFVFCMGDGMDSADFCVPLRGSFYLQSILFAIILGIAARKITASRSQSPG